MLVVTPTVAERYLTVAEGLAAAATTTGTIGALAPCLATATSASESTCVQSFIHDFGARVFRRPLAAAEATALGKLFADARGDGDTLAQAVAVTLTGMLQSTAFLYRAELSPPAAGQTVAALSPFELASRLSYLLWGSMPDDTLMAAAAPTSSRSTDAIAAQARRMLDDPRARAQVANFDGQWLDTAKIASIQKDAASYPGLHARDRGRDEDRNRHVRRRGGVERRRQPDGSVHGAVHLPEQGAVRLLRRGRAGPPAPASRASISIPRGPRAS